MARTRANNPSRKGSRPLSDDIRESLREYVVDRVTDMLNYARTVGLDARAICETALGHHEQERKNG